jgi:transposase InsO family protein
MDLGEPAERIRFLIRDRDAKYASVFDQVFSSLGVRVIQTPVRAPQANAIAGRWIGTVRRECTDRVLIFSERHLRHFGTHTGFDTLHASGCAAPRERIGEEAERIGLVSGPCNDRCSATTSY